MYLTCGHLKVAVAVARTHDLDAYIWAYQRNSYLNVLLFL